MLTISVWPRRLKEFLLTHPLYKSPSIGQCTPLLPTLSDNVQQLRKETRRFATDSANRVRGLPKTLG